MIHKGVASVLTGLEGQPPRGSTAKDDTYSLGECNRHDRHGRGDQKVCGVSAIVEYRNDQGVGHPTDHEGRGDDGHSEERRPDQRDAKGQRMGAHKTPDETEPIAQDSSRS